VHTDTQIIGEVSCTQEHKLKKFRNTCAESACSNYIIMCFISDKQCPHETDTYNMHRKKQIIQL